MPKPGVPASESSGNIGETGLCYGKANFGSGGFGYDRVPVFAFMAVSLSGGRTVSSDAVIYVPLYRGTLEKAH